MPAISVPVLGFSVGLLFGWSARVRAGTRFRESAEVVWLVLFFAFLVYAPAASLLLAYNPDWSFGYLVPTGPRQTALLIGLGVFNAATVPLGYLLGRHSLQSGALGLARWAGGALGVVLLNTLVFASRLRVDASHAEFHNAFGTRDVAGSALGYTVLWVLLVVAIGITWTHNALRRRANQLPTTANLETTA